VPVRDVTTIHLELRAPEALRAAPEPREGLEFRRAAVPSPELSRALYTGVGADWWWVDRLGWDWARWHAHLARAGVETWVAYEDGTPAGYAELVAEQGDVELASFGLLPAFIGRGIGPRLLDAALRRAWAMTDPPPGRVWVHTCSLDGPAALRTYEARGMRRYREETAAVTLPDAPPEPWPGANRPRLDG
jgi:GNAT superfamily N-acetyltransferase